MMYTNGHSKILLRQAQDTDGPAIGALLWNNGLHVNDMDWSRVSPFWLVVEHGDEIVGAIQVLIGLPVARIEFLVVKSGYDKKTEAMITKKLVYEAMASAAKGGAQWVAGTIPYEFQSYMDVLINRGGNILHQGNVVIKRVA